MWCFWENSFAYVPTFLKSNYSCVFLNKKTAKYEKTLDFAVSMY